MGACQYGATKIVGKPSTIRPSDADMQRWFGDFYYQWWGPLTVFMGEVFDVDAIVASNPDMPTPPAEIQVKDSLMGAQGQMYDVQLACRKWIEYSIFYENSQCNAPAPSSYPYTTCQQSTWNRGPLYDVTGFNRVDWTYSFSTWGAQGWEFYITAMDASLNGLIMPDGHNYWFSDGGADSALRTRTRNSTNDPGWFAPNIKYLYFLWRSLYGAAPTTCGTAALNIYTGAPQPPPSITMPTYPNIPPYVVQTGCSTDDVCRLVQMVLNKLDALYDPIKATQRVAAPYGYVAGSVHAGLTGKGSFAVSGLLGLAVNVTAIPPGVGLEDGQVVTYFSLGRLALGTTDGNQRDRIISHQHQLFLDCPPSATSVAYSLRPGVVATITELKPEP